VTRPAPSIPDWTVRPIPFDAASADVVGAVLALTTGTSGAAYGTWAVTA
jgi:hypothetical protein